MEQRTISDLIDQLGGDVAVGKALGVTHRAVNQWRHNKSIRVKYWAGLRELARQKQVKLNNNQLVEMHELERIEP